jgi:hypothetical protein
MSERCDGLPWQKADHELRSMARSTDFFDPTASSTLRTVGRQVDLGPLSTRFGLQENAKSRVADHPLYPLASHHPRTPKPPVSTAGMGSELAF